MLVNVLHVKKKSQVSFHAFLCAADPEDNEMRGLAQNCQSCIEHSLLCNKSVIYSPSLSSAAPEMVMVRSCVLLSKAPSSVTIVLGIKVQRVRKHIEIY